jgi:hypothetical protein
LWILFNVKCNKILFVKWNYYCSLCYTGATFSYESYIRFLWLQHSRQILHFTLQNLLPWSYSGIYHCIIFFVWRRFSLQIIEKWWLQGSQRNTRGYTTLLMNLSEGSYLPNNLWNCLEQNSTDNFLSKTFMNILRHIFLYYEFVNP